MGAKNLVALVLVLVGFPLWCDEVDQVVTQTLRWNPVEGALGYELKVWNPAGVVLQRRVDEPRAVLELKPGTYLFSVTVFNVLDQPEVESLPRELVVLRAEIPQPEALLPGEMDEADPAKRFVLKGSMLVEGATVDLVAQKGGGVTSTKVVGRAEGQWILECPLGLAPGVYDLVVQNPGGLKRTLRGALRVNAERAVDLRWAAGWVGGLPVFDSWFLDIWGRGLAQGVVSRADVVFVKRLGYQFGAGLDARAWSQSGDLPNLTIETGYASAGIEGFATLVLGPNLRTSVRVGGGLTDSRHVVTYDTSEETAWESVDPYASVEINGSYWVARWLYFEAGLDLSVGFNNGYTSGMVRPVALVGVSY